MNCTCLCILRNRVVAPAFVHPHDGRAKVCAISAGIMQGRACFLAKAMPSPGTVALQVSRAACRQDVGQSHMSSTPLILYLQHVGCCPIGPQTWHQGAEKGKGLPASLDCGRCKSDAAPTSVANIQVAVGSGQQATATFAGTILGLQCHSWVVQRYLCTGCMSLCHTEYKI